MLFDGTEFVLKRKTNYGSSIHSAYRSDRFDRHVHRKECKE
jgi:hypothetical protein